MEFLGIHLELGSIESTAFTFGFLLVFGVIGGRLARMVGLPAITGYLLVGILLNPQVSHIISSGHWADVAGGVAGETEWVPGPVDEVAHLVNPIAFSIIAYIIGGSLRLDNLRGMGKSVGIVTLMQGLAPFIFVTLMLFLLVPIFVGGYLPDLASNDYLAMGLAAGAISLATAPAAVVAILHEFKAKGPLTTTILAVVALDDALAVVCFALVAGLSVSLLNHGEVVPVSELIAHPAYEIIGSLLLGTVFAFILIYILRFLRRQKTQTTMAIVGLVVVCGGLAQYLGMSIILANMAFGFIIVNRTKSPRMIDAVVSIEDIVFILFFTLAGATFLAGEAIDADILTAIAVIGAVIVLGRCIGKFSGSYLGAKVAGSPKVVQKYLGYALLPKAGVSIALATALGEKEGFDSISSVLIGAIIFSTIINELISPPLAKYGILKSGEGRAAAPR